MIAQRASCCDIPLTGFSLPCLTTRFTPRKLQTTPGRLTLPGTESQEIGTSPHDASAGHHARATIRPFGGSAGTTPRDRAEPEGALPGNKTPNSHPHLVSMAVGCAHHKYMWCCSISGGAGRHHTTQCTATKCRLSLLVCVKACLQCSLFCM